MKECLACHRDIPDHASTCPFCSVILAKWRPRQLRSEAPLQTASEGPTDLALPKAMEALQFTALPQTNHEPGLNRPLVLGAVVLGVLLLSAVAYLVLMDLRKVTLPNLPNVTKSSSSGTSGPVYDPNSDFDLSVQLDGDPLGLVCNQGEFVIGNRATPWGFIRLKWDGEAKWESDKVPVMEPVYNQQVAIWTIAWNGTHYIGYCDGAYYGSPDKKVFTVHDAKTLRVVKVHPAPELIGGLVWDGKGYWAGTRRNTEDSGEAAFLYRLDENFKVIGKSTPPNVGCQGLAWDGSYLWWVDVFSDSIYLLATHNGPPAMAHSYQTRFTYLSGISYDGKNIWITEYDKKQLHRLNPNLLAAWSRGDFKASHYGDTFEAVATPNPAVDPSASTADPAAMKELLKKLREDPYGTRAAAEELTRVGAKEQAIGVLREMIKDSDQAVQMRAKSALIELGAPINYDRYSRSSTTSTDDAKVVEATAELRGDTLYGSWKVYFGSELFSRSASRQEGVISMPTFATYRMTVSGGSLAQPVVKEYEASEGYNTRNDQELASGLGPGKYKIEIFVHAQYVASDGTNKIINSSMPSLEVDK